MTIHLFDTWMSQPKNYQAGTHRTMSPAATLERFMPLMPRLGITRLADITGLDCIGLPVYVSVRPNSRALSTSQGKGFDDASAKASALMESIESWHAERVRVPLVHDSYAGLRKTGEAAVDPARLALTPRSVVSHNTPIHWARGWDIGTSKWTWVPYEAVTLNFVVPPGYRPSFVLTSNGLSSGNHPIEAVVHGLCELIERDAHAMWRLKSDSEVQQSQIDLNTVDDPLCRMVLRLLADAGVNVAVWDITSDLQIPAFTCKIFESPDEARWRPIGPADGHGCHPSAGVALMRALSEAVQSRLTLISGSRDDVFYRAYEMFTDLDIIRRRWEQLSATRPSRPFRSVRSVAGEMFDDDVRTLLNSLKSVGLENVIAVDLSRPDIGVPVVKVLVPGLESHADTLTYTPGVRAASKGRAA